MPMIAEAEAQRRRNAVASSEGSLAMEGLRLDATMADLSRQYAEGELDLEEFGRRTDEYLARLAASAQSKELTAVA